MARPQKKLSEVKNLEIRARVDVELFERIQTYCERKRLNFSTFVRIACLEYLDNADKGSISIPMEALLLKAHTNIEEFQKYLALTKVEEVSSLNDKSFEEYNSGKKSAPKRATKE